MLKSEEVIVVGDDDFALFEFSCSHADGGDDFLVFGETRSRGLVGEDETVRDEVAVVRFVAEIAAVSEEFDAVVIEGADAVVAPFPDESALHVLVGVEGLPVGFESAGSVAHGVSVLAHDRGILALVAVDEVVPSFRIGIHVAENVDGEGVSLVAFVMDEAGGVDFTHGGGHFDEVGREFFLAVRIAGFVAEGPAEDAGVVFETLNHAGSAFDDCFFPRGIVCGVALPGLRTFAEAVSFEVGFCKDVKTVLVADLVESRIVGVV